MTTSLPSPAPPALPGLPSSLESPTSARPVVLVSACLMGVACRYDGHAKLVAEFAGPRDDVTRVPVCPEELGQLATPRAKAELRGGDGSDVLDGRARVVDERGHDVTDAFLAGAARTTSIALAVGASAAWLTERSPSCGVRVTHADGGVIDGHGVTTAALLRLGLTVRGVGDPASKGSGARTTAP